MMSIFFCSGISGGILVGVLVVIMITAIYIYRQHRSKRRNHRTLISSSLSSTRILMPQLSHGDSRSVESNECNQCIYALSFIARI